MDTEQGAQGQGQRQRVCDASQKRLWPRGVAKNSCSRFDHANLLTVRAAPRGVL